MKRSVCLATDVVDQHPLNRLSALEKVVPETVGQVEDSFNICNKRRARQTVMPANRRSSGKIKKGKRMKRNDTSSMIKKRRRYNKKSD